MKENQRIGFIGLGVMGEPICRNLAAKSELQVRAFDTQAAPLERLRATHEGWMPAYMARPA